MDASEILSASRIVPVVVIDDPATAVDLARSLCRAGLGCIEVTLRTATAVESIERIAGAVPEIIVGAGSIRTPAQMATIRDAGARFAVSPGSSEALIDAAFEQRMPFVPGALSATEMIRLLERGYRLQKFFPAELAGGVAMLRAVGAPLPEVRFFPTGGITVDLAPRYLALDSVACIGGSWIVPQKLLAARDFDAIEKLAGEAAALVA